MFRETLLESSSQSKKRRRWPMATAFILQMIAAASLVVIPMLTTGVIPVSARTMVFTPTIYQPHDAPTPTSGTPGTRVSGPTATPRVVPVYNDNPNVIRFGPPGTEVTPPNPWVAVGDGPPCSKCFEGGTGGSGPGGTGVKGPTEQPKRIPVSVLSEAFLINKVIPTYPLPAQRAGIQGDVKLHAIISRDGTIQSLSLIRGHALLAPAAIAAVEQWRYRPYILNGEPVEVETLITVSFKRTN